MVSLYYRTVAVLSYDGGQGCATQKGGFSLQISLEMGHHAGTSPILKNGFELHVTCGSVITSAWRTL